MKRTKPSFILIGGAPGVGKSTVARTLAHCFAEGVSIEVDQVRLMVNRPKWKDQDEHRMTLRFAAILACQFARKGFGPVVVIDVFGGVKPLEFRQVLRRALPKSEVQFFALWATPLALERRMSLRPEGFFKDLNVSLKINAELGVSSIPSFGHVIDNTDSSPEEVARFIKNYGR